MIDQGIRAKYELECDLIDNLDTYGASMQESIELLMANLTRHSDSRSSLAVLLFTQYRNFGNQNGQFLSIIEDIDFQDVMHSSIMKKLGVAKQRLYDGLGQLFFKMQTMTDHEVPLDRVIADMQVAAQSIHDAIRLVCEHMAALVHERNLLNQDGSFAECKREGSPEESVHNTSTESIKSSSISEFLKDSNDTLQHPLPPHVLNMIPNHDGTNVAPTIKMSNRSSAPLADTSLYNHLSYDDDIDDDTDEMGDANNQDDKSSSPTPIPISPIETRSNQTDAHPFLHYDYNPGEIVFTMDGNVKGGTLRALVERMTLNDNLDMNFNTTFLLTYRSFCTSMDLIELLEARYNIQPPEGLSDEDLEIWTSKKQKLIRLRVFNVIKIWLEQYYYEEDSIMLDRLLYFTNTSVKESSTFACNQLQKLIHRRKQAWKDLKKIVVTHPVNCPDPILPRNLKKFRLLDL
ncbi:hypothetical protein K501DRAFT_195578, partial [Backusella circina FSU 941]